MKNQLWNANPIFIAAVDPDHMHDKPAALDNKIVSSALSLAAVSGGNVQLFHSAWVPPLAGAYPLVADEENEECKLTDLAKNHGICKTCCHWSDENIVDALPAKVKELDASAVVMGAVSRSRFDRILIGNTAEKVLDQLRQ